jgi:hypothetical protein
MALELSFWKLGRFQYMLGKDSRHRKLHKDTNRMIKILLIMDYQER